MQLGAASYRLPAELTATEPVGRHSRPAEVSPCPRLIHSTISAWTRPGLRGPRHPPARRGLTEPTPSPHAHRWSLWQDLRRPGDGKLPKRWAQVTPAETEAPARDGGAPRRRGSTLLPAARHWAAALGGGGAGPAPAGGHPAGEVEPAAPGPPLGPPDLGPRVASGQLVGVRLPARSGPPCPPPSAVASSNAPCAPGDGR